MKQYYNLKQKYPDAILLFRVGDFFETFGEDAIKSAEILGITLTKRSNGAASDMELAGFPHHALEVYLPKFVRSGCRVAVCDQLEDPKKTKKLVKRGVTELVTPGTSLHSNTMEDKANNYLAAIHCEEGEFGLALCDLTTGEFWLSEGGREHTDKLLQTFQPSEILHSRQQKDIFAENFGNSWYTYQLDDWLFANDFAEEKLLDHFKTQNLKGFGVDDLAMGITAAGVVIHYLIDNKHQQLGHVNSLRRLEAEKSVWLDKFTIRNLELVRPQFPDGSSLLKVLDRSCTPMGSRMMHNWLLMPLKELKEIRSRHEIVDYLIKNENARSNYQGELREIGDLERLISKAAMQRINPREVWQIKRALFAIEKIKSLGEASGKAEVEALADRLNPCTRLAGRIADSLVEDPPVNLNKGNVMRDGLSEELDEVRKLSYSGKDYLLQIQQREAERTGISSLKLSFNNVFGYYLEVRNTHKDKVPEEWIRKQTLVNAERYITEELKEYEEKILSAEDKMHQLEQELYNELIAELNEYITQLQQSAQGVAALDVLCAFAEISESNGYKRPELTNGRSLEIIAGRHPVIEKTLPMGEEYIPNDVFLDNDTQQIIILTGPNMSGKSALLRQTALITLMAQAGCFVPADKAVIGLVDKIFTRVGASDNLSTGESTFMVEMTETASILNNFSERSLILLDEIGRGTSTYDGVSIAWAISEYLHDHPFKPKTIFATHYHELNEIAGQKDRVRNFHVSVRERKGKILFLRKLQEGGSEHSFGIHVAQLAGVPRTVVDRSEVLLALLENNREQIARKEKFIKDANSTMQLNLFEVNDPQADALKKELNKIDINATSPMEALMKLNFLKGLIEKEN